MEVRDPELVKKKLVTLYPYGYKGNWSRKGPGPEGNQCLGTGRPLLDFGDKNKLNSLKEFKESYSKQYVCIYNYFK